MNDSLTNRNFESEFVFSNARSSGPGGQNVNKVNSKVELRFSVANSAFLNEIEKNKIYHKLKNRINTEGELIITAQNERSQLKNKEQTIRNFYLLIEQALKTEKKRKPTKPTKSSVEKRIKNKKILSEKKKLRHNLD